MRHEIEHALMANDAELLKKLVEPTTSDYPVCSATNIAEAGSLTTRRLSDVE